MLDLESLTTHRRGFLGRVAAGAAAVGLGGLFAPLKAAAEPLTARGDASANPDFEAWLNKITGKHKMVFDVPEPNDGFAFAWGRVFLNTTNEAYGTTDAQNTVVIVLRHSGIPFAMESAMWAKYKFGEAFKITDPATKGPAIRHPLIRLKPGDVPIPGMGTDELLAKGVQHRPHVQQHAAREGHGDAGRGDQEGVDREPAPRRAGGAVGRDRDQSRAGEGVRLLLRGVTEAHDVGAQHAAPLRSTPPGSTAGCASLPIVSGSRGTARSASPSGRTRRTTPCTWARRPSPRSR